MVLKPTEEDSHIGQRSIRIGVRYRMLMLSTATTGAIMQKEPAFPPRMTTRTRKPLTRYF
jgi:hypothetical protein